VGRARQDAWVALGSLTTPTVAQTTKGVAPLSVPYDDVVHMVRAFAATIVENKEYLTDLDSAIGDADHGINMDRGFRAVLVKVDALPPGDVGSLFKTIGMTLVSTVGGASGPLYGTLFLQLGAATAGKTEITPEDWSTALAAAVQGVQARGKAELQDKTMVDALAPARDAFAEALAEGASFGDALRRSAMAGEEGMKGTIPLVARKGRASYLGERSAGHQDPGATSSFLLLKTVAEAWRKG
jgi:dihydroxyacetone kinase-like protein